MSYTCMTATQVDPGCPQDAVWGLCHLMLLYDIIHYGLETLMAGIVCFSFSLKAFANMLGG